MARRKAVWGLVAVAAAVLPAWPAAAGQPVAVPPETVLASDGRAAMPVVTAAAAPPRVQAAAAELADYLGRIAGARFDVTTGDGTTGVAVGVASDFPALHLGVEFAPQDPFRREEYVIRTHARGLWLVGASDAAVERAVWDLLDRLGYRLFFPTDTWEVVPHRPRLAVAVDAVERPDFINRSAPRGPGSTDARGRQLWERWRRRNRVESAFVLSTGHAYAGIIRANLEEFQAHPEYYALVDGQRKDLGETTKLCIANPALRRLVVDHAVRWFRRNGDADSISMDPSDGGNWCQCPDCARMGSTSDRVVTLANEVAEAVNRLGLGTKYVGIYAYSEHSPPPSVAVHPNVIVSVATAFIRGGYTVEELLAGWRARGATLGIREYHDVYTWSHDLPRRAKGGDLAYLARTIPYFHEQGARFMNSEASDSWGANGLGYYITPRLLWNVRQAERVDELVEDFLEKAFGRARQPMRRFYHLLSRDRTPRSAEDVVARMYRDLAEARRLADDPAVLERLTDLILYTRYVELFGAYQSAIGQARQAAFEAVVRHAYRIKDRMMVHYQQVYRDLAARDRSVSIPPEAAWDVPEPRNPWKTSKPFSRREVDEILEAGLAANRVDEPAFEPVAFSADLVPASPLRLPDVPQGTLGRCFRGVQRLFVWLPNGQAAVELTVAGGQIYADRGNVRMTLATVTDAGPATVARDESVPPDRRPHAVALRSAHEGLHLLEWTDGAAGTEVSWPAGAPAVLPATIDAPFAMTGRWSLYFYVPRGTRVVGGFAEGAGGAVLDADGRKVFSFDDPRRTGYFRVPVPEGQQGRLWKFEACSGRRALMTVPPYLVRSARELLLPREVVEKDAAR